MNVIDKFLARYAKEYDFYREAARLCAQKCETGLERSGIRAIVTHRAKRPDRLRDKLFKRHEKRKYRNVDDIYKDIVDLAGVRIAIYFPGDREEVDKFIASNFEVKKLKEFPDGSVPSYLKRFSGYGANHYRLYLKTDNFTDENKRYGQALVEIQVASVLMHAWAEVEHDLVYKPLSGNLSEDEYAILDELNGLVLAGEIALERLQKAVKKRVGERGKLFNNHYELSAFLYDSVQKYFADKSREPIMGRADILHMFLQISELDRPECLEQYLLELDTDTEKRPIVDQIVDRILATNPNLYEVYNRSRVEVGVRNPYSSRNEKISYLSDEQALGYFISRWIAFEYAIRKIARKKLQIPEIRFMLNANYLLKLGILEENYAYEIESIRRMRNEVVHGIEFPPEEQLTRAGQFLENLLKQLSNSLSDEFKDIVNEALSKIA